MKRLKQLTEQPKKIDIVPTHGQDKGMNVSYKNPGVPGERDFKDKHVIAKTDYPVPEKNAGDKDELFSGGKRTKKNRIADQENETNSQMYEAAANKKAEEIVQSMKKNKSDFVSRYGKDAESVMYATANKMSQEDFDPEQDGMWLLDDDSEVKIETVSGNKRLSINRGTGSTEVPLLVRRTDASGIVAEFSNSGGYGVYIGQNGATGEGYIRTATGQPLVFTTNSGSGIANERLRIDSSGTLKLNQTDSMIMTNADASRLRLFGGSSNSVNNGAVLTLHGVSHSNGNYADLASGLSLIHI